VVLGFTPHIMMILKWLEMLFIFEIIRILLSKIYMCRDYVETICGLIVEEVTKSSIDTNSTCTTNSTLLFVHLFFPQINNSWSTTFFTMERDQKRCNRAMSWKRWWTTFNFLAVLAYATSFHPLAQTTKEELSTTRLWRKAQCTPSLRLLVGILTFLI